MADIEQMECKQHMQPIIAEEREGYRHGKQAAWFVAADWENLLNKTRVYSR